MPTLACIPARGGSKRIPYKNIKPFNGKPIIYYPIQACLKVFDKVVVSTEDPEIKGVAEAYGAEVYDRPVNLADDFTPAGEVIADCLSHYKGFDTVACVYPCAVFATKKILFDTLQNFLAKREVTFCKSIYPVVKYSHPIQRALKITTQNYVEMVDSSFASIRTQDCEPRYHDAGQFYIMDSETLLRERSLYFADSMPIIMNENQVHDIDSIDDWEIAETKYKLCQK